MSENEMLMAAQQQMVGQPTKQSELVGRIARLSKAVDALSQVASTVETHLSISNQEVSPGEQVNKPPGQPTLLMLRMDALDNIADRVIVIDRVMHRILTELQNL